MTMPSIDIRLDGDGALKEWEGRVLEHRTNMIMTGLRDGTASGKPTFMFALEMPGGTALVIETSALLLEASIRAFKARWGLDTNKPFDGQV